MADQTTAEALADHQRWEWPLAVLIGGDDGPKPIGAGNVVGNDRVDKLIVIH